jgi:lysophospholipid acyltransferase (LPLAT)-like uncharacterized protein
MSSAPTSLLTELKWRLVGILGKGVIDILFAASPVETVGYDRVADLIASRRFIGAVWHSRILLPCYLYQGWTGVAMVSRSADGEIIARILSRQGYTPVRGSTRRGGKLALAEMTRRMEATPQPAVIIPDGPRGPRFQVQPGVITLAQQTGYPIIPITYGARRAKVFRSWDRFVLPLPGTRCRMIYGEPLVVPPVLRQSAVEVYCKRLERELNAITAAADARFGRRLEGI